ncbi:MAG: hopanoid biosynthesis associated radical SAM protein HpnH [Nitrospinae bacterium CG11_big_fil_rev_8_21_14_0_20_56_8]|nr:MAG: hopanoid biosynthesis associated radical SAM protein HpnH [Nitrospinae bacterium CG11_big_fil_rev_8_21_14_0_20_56_8]
MGIPIRQALKVGLYVASQKFSGRKRFPLVLMLEPLFRCNLECVGCGKIQKPNEILKQHLTPEQCFQAARECGAPVVSVAGGEPLMHPQIVEIIEGLIAQDRYVYLCTNALLLKDFLGKLPVSPLLVLSIHLDGLEEEHDRIAAKEGTFRTAVDAIREAKSLGYRVTSNSTFFDATTVDEAEKFLDYLRPLGVDGMTIAAGFSYPDAPDQDHFLGRERTQKFFRELLSRNRNGRWNFNHSPLYLEFLKGNKDYNCTPWGNPNFSVLGWQRPCYLLDEGYCETFNELINETDWNQYGHRNNRKCANCTAHCGYEATAVDDSTSSLGNMVLSAKAIF